VCFIVVGFFQLVKYVPSVEEALILATTVKPETFTELYFEDHLSLPNQVTLFKENIPRYLRHYKVDVTLEPDAGLGAIRVILV
jgi:hypothetical protein